MQFFFTWVKEKDVFPREDVLGFHLSHAEGDFPTLTVTLKNEGGPAISPGTLGRFGLYQGDQARALFEGDVLGAPSILEEGTVCYTLTSKNLSALEAFQRALAALKKGPEWDPLFVAPGFEDQPRELLDGYSFLPHWGRIGGSFCWSDILKGRHTIVIGDAFFKESLRAKVLKNPIDQLDVEMKAEWTQSYGDVVNVGPVIREAFPGGRIDEDRGKALEKHWWKAPLKLKDSGYELVESRLTPVLDMTGQRHYEPSVQVAWGYLQKREEICAFQLLRPGAAGRLLRRYSLKMHLNDIRLDGSLPYWTAGTSYVAQALVLYGGKVYEAKVPHGAGPSFAKDRGRWKEKEGFADGRYYPASSFFTTPRGHAAITHGLSVALAYLKASSRAYSVEVEVPLAQILDLSCDHTLKIALPQGTVFGKVVFYEMISKGPGAFGRVKILVSDMENFQGQLEYAFSGNPKPQTGLVDPKLVTRSQLVESVLVDLQEETEIRLDFMDLTTTDVLRHRIALTVRGLS